MGCGGSTDNGATPEEVAVSRAIDQQLKKEKAAMQGNVKILLLGMFKKIPQPLYDIY